MKKLVFLFTLCAVICFSGCGTPKQIESAQQPAAAQTEQPVQDTKADDRQEKPKTGQLKEAENPVVTKSSTPVQSPPKETKTPDISKKSTSTGESKKSTMPEPPKKNTPATGTQKQDELKETPKKQVITLSIQGTSDQGTILSATEIEWSAGDTVFSVLKRITREKKIQMEYSGSGNSVYIEGIDNLYEFDKGPGSGWIYRVNGKMSSKSAGAQSLSPGDRVTWSYTLNAGKDLE